MKKCIYLILILFHIIKSKIRHLLQEDEMIKICSKCNSGFNSTYNDTELLNNISTDDKITSYIIKIVEIFKSDFNSSELIDKYLYPRVIYPNIELKSVSTKAPKLGQVDDNIGYIRLSSFISKNAASEFKTALKSYEDKDGIIIDLRSNPGGLLTNAIYIADMFLSSKVIVSTVDKYGYKETQKSMSQVTTNQPIVVLINGGSASASEILSGALKDNNRAIIVGKKSFGKGLVQQISKLPDGSALHITIQKYLTPNGTDIHKKGIVPDYVVELTEQDVKEKRDPQLAKACEIIQQQVNKNTTVSSK